MDTFPILYGVMFHYSLPLYFQLVSEMFLESPVSSTKNVLQFYFQLFVWTLVLSLITDAMQCSIPSLIWDAISAVPQLFGCFIFCYHG